MLKLKNKHFLTGEELDRDEAFGLLDLAQKLKETRGSSPKTLEGKHLAMLFEKPSLRTRLSFVVAMQELGGHVVESLSSNSKREEPEDVARVLGGYVHAVMLRTHEHSALNRMAAKSPIPIINGLSDDHHPCQAFADLLTLKQRFGSFDGLKLAYVGDGNNVLHSLLLLAPFLGVQVSYACPKGYEPSAFIVKKARARAKESGGSITACSKPADASKGAHALYTDVWTSMGFEEHKEEREKSFHGYQLDAELYSKAAPNAIIMHCLPMIRGKEISDAMADHPNAALFQQSENRLHVQKALLIGLMGRA